MYVLGNRIHIHKYTQQLCLPLSKTSTVDPSGGRMDVCLSVSRGNAARQVLPISMEIGRMRICKSRVFVGKSVFTKSPICQVALTSSPAYYMYDVSVLGFCFLYCVPVSTISPPHIRGGWRMREGRTVLCNSTVSTGVLHRGFIFY